MAQEQSGETQWTKVDSNSYVDKSGIVGTNEIYGFTFLLKSYNKGQYEPINGKKISYTLGQYTIDCGKRSYKIGVIDSYDNDDNFVSGDYNRYAQFRPIVSGTSVSVVADMICRP